MLCLAMATLQSTAASAQDKAEKKLYCWSENGQQVCGDVAVQLTNPAYSYPH